jgi:hypothetical protein
MIADYMIVDFRSIRSVHPSMEYPAGGQLYALQQSKIM